jgi:hypothetical protein
VGPEAHHRGNGLFWDALDGLIDHTPMARVEAIKTPQGEGCWPTGLLWRAERNQGGAEGALWWQV